MHPYSLHHHIPSSAVYRHLRVSAGLSDKSESAAATGLAGSLFAVMVRLDDEPVGMGRVIGDGGLFFQVVDIAVLPAHQGQGLGKAIMQAIASWLETHVPASGYVSLIADGQAQQLYARYGFALTAPQSVGMARRF
jgi:GNAT superfamily N-acetyltransferase